MVCQQARGIAEREERVDHLNDTSFDRRRKVAVYKSDGKRGHHMQVPSKNSMALQEAQPFTCTS